MLAMMPLASFAQDGYRPLVEQGKKWTYHHNAYQYVYDYHYTLEGDTVVEGKDCLKMYSDNRDNKGEIRYEGALYEENKKVYCFYPEKDEAALLYDFNCKVGDTLSKNSRDLIVLSIDTIVGVVCKGEYYALQVQEYDEEKNDSVVLGTLYWIEGVGATKDFFNMLPLAGNYNSLIACEVNGEVLYQTSTAIQSVRSRLSNDHDAIFDLQGRRLSATPAKGVYIQNGKKRIVR
ncbi:MAG: hypothetical protein VZR00_12410 [Lachnospiraceae bacterium]|nr:hypothetical protein [Lachnospiraceae bacterium]